MAVGFEEKETKNYTIFRTKAFLEYKYDKLRLNRKGAKMEFKKILNLAKEKGFTNVTSLDLSTIELRPEVRQMCQDNKCKLYDTNWACPPGCGSLSECQKKIANYQQGIILQTTGTQEDSFDFEGMEETKKIHNKNFDRLVDELHRVSWGRGK